MNDFPLRAPKRQDFTMSTATAAHNNKNDGPFSVGAKRRWIPVLEKMHWEMADIASNADRQTVRAEEAQDNE